MIKYVIEDSTLTDIADAIREKTGITESITTNEMDGLIRSIINDTELTITVSVDSGATVTAKKGSFSISGISENNVAILKVPEGGVWTITATLNGKTATGSVELVVSTETVVSFLDPVFANNSWIDIIRACQSGYVPYTWSVGDSKTLNISKDYQVTIIGRWHDEYADGSGWAPLTLQLQDCYGKAYTMNNSQANTTGWEKSKMRTDTLPALLDFMPDEVKTNIKEVRKTTSFGNNPTFIGITKDKLFLLSEIEVFGTENNAFVGEGTQYDYYYYGNPKTKHLNGSLVHWWLRSPYKNSSTSFCTVSDLGSNGLGLANGALGVSFAFCF